MTKTTKRLASFISAIAIMLSVICVAGVTNASADTDRVSLYYRDLKYSWMYKDSSVTYDIYVQTRGNASNEAVTVRYYTDYVGGWKDAAAEYVTTLNDGSKIWKAAAGGNEKFRFAIKFEADGEVFWDNNNGNDYLGAGTAENYGSRLGTAPIMAKRRTLYEMGDDRTNNEYSIFALLQNYAYNKNVFVRYTTDNWATYSDVQLSYDSTNADGTELWAAKLPVCVDPVYDNGYYLPAEGFEYAICYQVNGQEYWANNGGANYGSDHFLNG